MDSELDNASLGPNKRLKIGSNSLLHKQTYTPHSIDTGLELFSQ